MDSDKSPFPKKIEKVLRPVEKDINAWLLSAHGFLPDFAFLAGWKQNEGESKDALTLAFPATLDYAKVVIFRFLTPKTQARLYPTSDRGWSATDEARPDSFQCFVDIFVFLSVHYQYGLRILKRILKSWVNFLSEKRGEKERKTGDTLTNKHTTH